MKYLYSLSMQINHKSNLALTACQCNNRSLSVPSMVKVFPVPVCPYANTVQLYPSNTSPNNGRTTALYTSIWKFITDRRYALQRCQLYLNTYLFRIRSEYSVECEFLRKLIVQSFTNHHFSAGWCIHHCHRFPSLLRIIQRPATKKMKADMNVTASIIDGAYLNAFDAAVRTDDRCRVPQTPTGVALIYL